MNVIKAIFLSFFLISIGMSCQNNTPSTESKAEPATEEITSGLRHVVLFKFKPETTPANIKEIETAFARLPSQIKEIRGFEWSNKNISPENLDRGFTHYYVLTFDDAKGRNIYLPHPAHGAFGAIVGPHLAEEGVLVFDYNF